MSREMLIAIICGGLSALASTAIGGGLPGGIILVYLAPLPLLLAGLGLGAQAAMIAGLAGFMISGLMGGVMAAGLYAVIDAMPVWLAVSLLLFRKTANGVEQWFSLGPVVAWLSLMGAIILGVSAMTFLGGGFGFEAAVSAHLSNAFNIMAPLIPEETRSELVALMAPLFPGTVGSSWVVMMIINTALAQAILTRRGWNMRPSPALADLTLPHWTSWLVVGAATLALLGQGQMEYMGRNLAMVLAAPFFFQGLSVVHYAARYVTFPGTLLAFSYFVLLVSGWALLLAVGIGMIEQWAGLRIRFTGPPNTSGDE